MAIAPAPSTTAVTVAIFISAPLSCATIPRGVSSMKCEKSQRGCDKEVGRTCDPIWRNTPAPAARFHRARSSGGTKPHLDCLLGRRDRDVRPSNRRGHRSSSWICGGVRCESLEISPASPLSPALVRWPITRARRSHASSKNDRRSVFQLVCTGLATTTNASGERFSLSHSGTVC